MRSCSGDRRACYFFFLRDQRISRIARAKRSETWHASSGTSAGRCWRFSRIEVRVSAGVVERATEDGKNVPAKKALRIYLDCLATRRSYWIPLETYFFMLFA